MTLKDFQDRVAQVRFSGPPSLSFARTVDLFIAMASEPGADLDTLLQCVEDAAVNARDLERGIRPEFPGDPWRIAS